MTSNPADWFRLINPQVHEVWSGTWNAGNVEPARRLVDHELVLFEQGECELEIDGQRLAATPGTFVIVPPGQVHVTRAGSTRVTRHCVHFDWAPIPEAVPLMLWRYAPAALDSREIRKPPNFVANGIRSGTYNRRDRQLDHAIKRLIRCWSSADSLQQGVARATLLEILILLLMPHDGPPAARPVNDELAFQVRASMDRYQPADGSVRSTLASIGYSYEYLCRCFTAKFGISPLRYSNHIRLERARRLLEDDSLKVSAVGRLVGYEDAGYFIRCFRAYTGLSPARYALRHRQTQRV